MKSVMTTQPSSAASAQSARYPAGSQRWIANPTATTKMIASASLVNSSLTHTRVLP